MLTVDSFLCFTLETGGLIIGWLTLITNVLTAILSLVGGIIVSVIDCEDLTKPFGNADEKFDAEECSMLTGIIIGICVVVLLVSIGLAFIGHLCIKGTKNRIHSKVKPMVILLAICAIVSILNVLNFTARGIVSGIISAIIDAYCFVAIYSLYKVLREENELGNSSKQYQPPALKV